MQSAQSSLKSAAIGFVLTGMVMMPPILEDWQSRSNEEVASHREAAATVEIDAARLAAFLRDAK